MCAQQALSSLFTAGWEKRPSELLCEVTVANLILVSLLLTERPGHVHCCLLMTENLSEQGKGYGEKGVMIVPYLEWRSHLLGRDVP